MTVPKDRYLLTQKPSEVGRSVCLSVCLFVYLCSYHVFQPAHKVEGGTPTVFIIEHSLERVIDVPEVVEVEHTTQRSGEKRATQQRQGEQNTDKHQIQQGDHAVCDVPLSKEFHVAVLV